ncbi:MAG: MBL fold metallo-hydrolase [Clostridia bacterium]|nr:MBL fold metallo-hydrolase [Clostridia bacterium]
MKKKMTAAVLAGLLACTAVGSTAIVTAEENVTKDVKFHFVNVNDIPGYATIGSADCIIIEDNGVITMIDAGYYVDYSVDKVINYLKNMGVTKIDHLLLSHPHNDHAGGMPRVINEFDIDTLYLKASDWASLYQHEQGKKGTRVMYDDVYLAATRKLNSDGSTIKMVEPNEDGMTITVNEHSSFELWNCVDPWEDHNYRPEFNDFSIVMKYTHKDVSALLLADLNSYYESSFAGQVGECEIFKVAHHGTWGTISTDDLFEETKSKVGVVTGIRGNFGTISRGEHYVKATENLLNELNIPFTATASKVTVEEKYAALLMANEVKYTANDDGTLNISIVGGNVEDVLAYYGIDCAITQDGDVIVTTDGADVWMKQNPGT